jgi:hypothetical protein
MHGYELNDGPSTRSYCFSRTHWGEGGSVRPQSTSGTRLSRVQPAPKSIPRPVTASLPWRQPACANTPGEHGRRMTRSRYRSAVIAVYAAVHVHASTT